MPFHFPFTLFLCHAIPGCIPWAQHRPSALRARAEPPCGMGTGMGMDPQGPPDPCSSLGMEEVEVCAPTCSSLSVLTRWLKPLHGLFLTKQVVSPKSNHILHNTNANNSSGNLGCCSSASARLTRGVSHVPAELTLLR